MSKVSRNDPCPCGSGKKYKKCCAIHDQQREHKRLHGVKKLPSLFAGGASPSVNLAKRVFKVLTKPMGEAPPIETTSVGDPQEVEQPKSFSSLEDLLKDVETK